MQRRLLKVYTDSRSRPYRIALRFLEFGSNSREVIEIYKYWSLPDQVAGALLLLAPECETFVDDLCELDDKRFMNSKHKTRRYFSRIREHIYINSPHLTETHSRQVGPVWFATNVGRIETLAMLSCAAISAGAKRKPVSELLA